MVSTYHIDILTSAIHRNVAVRYLQYYFMTERMHIERLH